MASNTKLRHAINFMKNLKEIDIKELDGDTTSNYALHTLEGHIDIDVAIEIMEAELDKRLYNE